MLQELELLIKESHLVQSRLILVVDGTSAQRSHLLAGLAEKLDQRVVHLGIELGRELIPLAQKKRRLTAGTLLKETVDRASINQVAILDGIEILFDPSLKMDPIEILRQVSRQRPTVASWPGKVEGKKLIYAEPGHPEHRDCGLNGIIIFNYS